MDKRPPWERYIWSHDRLQSFHPMRKIFPFVIVTLRIPVQLAFGTLRFTFGIFAALGWRAWLSVLGLALLAYLSLLAWRFIAG